MKYKMSFRAYDDQERTLHTDSVIVNQALTPEGEPTIEVIQSAYDALPDGVKDYFSGFWFGEPTRLDS